METERSKKKSTKRADYEERKKNVTSRYMEDTRMRYLLASSKESLQMLIESQKEELTRVLIELKSEYDLLTRESAAKKQLIEEYDKKITMIQKANETNTKKQEDKKEESNQIQEGIDIKKEKKEEELYTKKTLSKQVEKLNKDLFIIQKQIIKCENESMVLDKKKERAKLDENIIKEKSNQVYSKIEDQNNKNKRNQNENDLQIQYYETVIQQKSLFMQFADERKERQKKIEQEAKNDAQDKQEVEKRRKLKLLLLYNQYLRTRMDIQLKKYDDLEAAYEQIRDICGTQDLQVIVDFILLRDKRYNFACKIINDKEKKIGDLKRELKQLNSNLVKLKNEIIVNEIEEENSRTITTVDNTAMEQEEIEIEKKEKEENESLLILGKKHNEINLAYQKMVANINQMIEYEKEHPLNVKEEEDNIQEDEKESEGQPPQQQEKEAEHEGEDDNFVLEGERHPKENKLPQGKFAKGEVIEPEKLIEGEVEGEELVGKVKPKREIVFLKEELEKIASYEKLLKKIKRAFEVLYLCHSKQDFLNLMREKGINPQIDKSTSSKTGRRYGQKKMTRRMVKIETKPNNKPEIHENKKNNDDNEEEDDGANYDPDKNILNRFIKEQKKEIDDFINQKEKQANSKKQAAPAK